jgi:long-subunit fatty acid transport protein
VGIGGEYRLNALNRVISLRAGYMWDQCPIPDSTVSPASFQNDNHVFSIGTGFPIGPLYTDLFAAYVLTPDRDWDNSIGDARHPGKFSGNKRITGEFDDFNTFLFGIDLSYKF